MGIGQQLPSSEGGLPAFDLYWRLIVWLFSAFSASFNLTRIA